MGIKNFRTLCVSSFVIQLALLGGSQASFGLLNNDALLLDHKTAVELAAKSSESGSSSPAACKTLEQLSKNQNHLLKAEARLQFFAYCDRALTNDPFASAEVDQIKKNYPWLSNSARALRTLRLQTFTQAHIDAIPAAQAITIYLNGYKSEADRQEKIRLAARIEHLLSNPQHQTNSQTRALIASVAPRFLTEIRSGEHLMAGKDFLGHGEIMPARKIFVDYLNRHTSPTKESFEILKTLRDSYIGDDGNQAVFYSLSDKAVQWAPHFGERELYLARMRQARNVSFKDNGPDALKKLEVILKMKISNAEKAEVWILISKVHEAMGRTDLTVKPLNEAIKLGLSGELLNRVQFDLGRLYWKQKNFEMARQTFEKYRDRFTSGSDRAKGTFWMARALNKLNRKSDASKAVSEARDTDLYGYYGMIAAREMGRPLRALDFFSSSALQDYQAKMARLAQINSQNGAAITLQYLQAPGNNKAPAATHAYFIALLKAGQGDLFKDAAAHYVAALNPNSAANWPIAETYLEALQYVGDYLPTFKFSGAIAISLRNQVLRDHPGLFFPPGYYTEVKKYSVARGIDPSTTLAVIRQESAFNATIRSPVGAIGLMQLMPQTAASIAREMGIKNFDPKTLFIADTNVNFGTFLLNQNTTRFKGRFSAIVASYNGGPHNVEKWIRNSTAADEIEFVEDMVFLESRNYTKIVAKNRASFKMLIEPNATDAFPF